MEHPTATKTKSSEGFIDGDLVEQFLDLPQAKMEEICRGIKVRIDTVIQQYAKCNYLHCPSLPWLIVFLIWTWYRNVHCLLNRKGICSCLGIMQNDLMLYMYVVQPVYKLRCRTNASWYITYMKSAIDNCVMYPQHMDAQGTEVDVSLEDVVKLVEDLSRIH